MSAVGTQVKVGGSARAPIAVLVLLCACGLGVLAMTWRGVAAQYVVADQVAFIVSGGVGGLAMVGVSLAMLMVQTRRVTEARRRAEFDRVLDAAGELLEVARQRERMRS